MVCQKQVEDQSVEWQIADDWAELLYRQFPEHDRAFLHSQTREAMNDFTHFLTAETAAWDLQHLMLYLSSQPSLNDLMRVFMALRSAVRAALHDHDSKRMLYLSEQLDAWIQQVITRYDKVRAYYVHKYWSDMVKRIAQLNTLSYCTAELNASLDLISAYNATAQLAQVLTGADLCLVFQREGDNLRLKAYAGEGSPRELIGLDDARLLEELVVSKHHQDIAIEMARQKLGVPQAKAIHCTPLQTSNVTTGKLTAVYFKERTFSAQELRVQEIFASHAAQAIYNAELYERLSRLTTASERRRIACEMHDTMLQTLISLNINLRVMLNHAQQQDWDGLLPLLEEARRLGKVAVQEGRDTLNNLRDTEDCDGEQNLLDTLQAELATFAERSGIQPELTIQGEPLVSPAISHQICRLVGEALTNIHRHAHASRVQVSIEASAVELRLRIADDGIGFHPARIDHLKSFGLVGMKERARLMNARFEVHSVPGEGTVISVCCPLPGLKETS